MDHDIGGFGGPTLVRRDLDRDLDLDEVEDPDYLEALRYTYEFGAVGDAGPGEPIPPKST